MAKFQELMEYDIQILGTRYVGNHVNQIYKPAWLLERQLGAGFRPWALESCWLCCVSSNEFR